jgi:D-glycero-D-manno-heptose 1,7-bisphosphate phosphatase
MNAQRARAIVMDRDGTVCDEVGYVNHLSRIRLLPRSAAAIRRAREAGYKTVVVTNQAGVARGYFDEDLVLKVHDRVQEMLAAEGTRLDAIYYCPHHPDTGDGSYRKDCDCRKPRPGMLLRARDEMGIDLARSYVVGDSMRDIAAGRRVGATTILVLTGYGRGEYEYRSAGWTTRPDHIAEDLMDAVEWILARDGDAAATGVAP